MKRLSIPPKMHLLKALFLLVALGIPLAAGAQEATPVPATKPDAIAIAQQLLDRLDARDYAAAESVFDATMAAAVPADKLQAVWESLPAQVGAANGRGEAAVAEQDGMQVVQIPLHYVHAELLAKVAVTADGKIAGFLVQPAPPPAAAPPAADANFHESEVSVGEGERALPATLAMPASPAPAAGFPAVVLVQGSGPTDRDESIGANKPFLDIARGLAAQGIAVLRYEKRTKAHPDEFTGMFGIDDETTNDAVLAVALLRATPGIDPARVFVLGHSQGGMMAPRIAAVSSHVAGLILLAAPARPLLDILIEQNRRLAVLDDGKTSDAERAAIDQLVEEVRKIRDPATDPATPTILKLPAGYWRSTDAVDPVAEATKVALPMLVLQGARDIQVVDADWQEWKDAFHDDPKVTFKLYDKLNHLGIPGEGEGSLAEYLQPGHVDPQLIDDVATWIKAH